MNKITGVVVLTGGKSSRMGYPKETLLFQGKSFLEHVCEEMSFFTEKYISVNQEQQEIPSFDGYQLVVDEIAAAGPMGGIYSALGKCRSDGLLAIPCDMPFFTEREAKKLLSHIGEEDITIYRSPGGLQPLAAVYQKSCLPVMKRCLEEKQYKLGNIRPLLCIREVWCPEEKYFCNINTVKEYETFCKENNR